MDGAVCHKSKNLIIPKNITKKYYQKILPKNIKIILLPPYCKELNPVERLWKYIKDIVIRNKIFETLLELELAVCDFVSNLSIDIIKSVCGYNYNAL